MSERTPIPAFPIVTGQMTQTTGMDLRDYFAAAALQGLIANGGAGVWQGETVEQQHDIPRRAYLYADAMLKARDAS